MGEFATTKKIGFLHSWARVCYKVKEFKLFLLFSTVSKQVNDFDNIPISNFSYSFANSSQNVVCPLW